MPTIECLIKRVGPTPVILPMGGGKAPFHYTFWPHEFAEEGEPSTSKAEVTNPTHLKWMEKYPHTFRPFKAAQVKKDIEEEKRKSKENDYTGLSIEKYLEKGYIVIDRRDPKDIKYAGSTGQWKDTLEHIKPFNSEVNAWEWLKAEKPSIPDKKK